MLEARSRLVADTLEQLALIRGEFARNYAQMIEIVRHRGLPTAVCTITSAYPDAVQRRVAATALCVINDAIIREAARAGVPIIDLRLVCDEDEDFANPIEPSSHGGWKITGAIVTLVTRHDFGRARSEILRLIGGSSQWPQFHTPIRAEQPLPAPLQQHHKAILSPLRPGIARPTTDPILRPLRSRQTTRGQERHHR